ncbi:hypothetical protein Bhyg_03294, partial [Pseudolycoriella hygida]
FLSVMDVKCSLILIFCTLANANDVSIMPLKEEECTHTWKKYTGNTTTEFDGLEAGLFKPGIKAYVGRGIFDSQFVPGRFQIEEPTGLYHPSAWSVHRIIDSAEYLALNSSQSYEWVDSSDGHIVENAVIPGHTPGRTVHGEWLTPGGQGNAHYENGDNEEVATQNYQVLTCRLKSESGE